MVFEIEITSCEYEGNSCVNLVNQQHNHKGRHDDDDDQQHEQRLRSEHNDDCSGGGGGNDVHHDEQIIKEEVDSSEGPMTVVPVSNPNIFYDEPKFVGLKNLGNTCYANSTLQALYGSNKLRQYLLNLQHPSTTAGGGGGRIQFKLSKLFQQMHQMGNKALSTNRYAVIKPEEFICEFRLIKPQFVRNEQHDAQEFLTILLECIHQEDNKIKKNKLAKLNVEPKNAQEAWQLHLERVDNSFYSRLFVGQSESVLECFECKHSSLSWSSFWQLNLHLKNDNENGNGDRELSIQQCIQEYMAWEVCPIIMNTIIIIKLNESP